MKYILAQDQGTTSSRAILFDKNAKIIKQSQIEHKQICKQAGWVEHDANEIWQNQLKTIIEVTKDIKISEISSIGITNQRETLVAWNKDTAKPIYNAIVWQDKRTSQYCKNIAKEHEEKIYKKTGLKVDSYFSASKANWIINNVDKAKKLIKEDKLCFGTIDSWLIFKLTGQHLSEYSNASRTLLFNINSLQWDQELLDIFEIPKNTLAKVLNSSGEFATCNIKELKDVPISGVAGDQQSALFGQMCWEEGQSKNTYGTGCFFLKNIGNTPKLDQNFSTTIAWKINDKVEYALEGSVFVGGAVIQWLRDNLEIIKDSSEAETLANSIQDNCGVYFVPAFSGLGTPYWNQDAKGIITGLTKASTKAHITRAALESIAFQVAELIKIAKVTSLKVDGGACKNDTLMQFQADITGVEVHRAKNLESTALGAAFLAGLASSFWKDKNEIKKLIGNPKVFKPSKDLKHLVQEWEKAVKKCIA